MLKDEIKLEAGELIDASYISKKKLCEFFEKEIADCKVSGFIFYFKQRGFTKTWKQKGAVNLKSFFLITCKLVI